MKILGIHSGHNATAALCINGCLKSAVSQEKMDNLKNSARFPHQAIEELCSLEGISLKEIDSIAIAGKTLYPQKCYDYLFQKPSEQKPSGRGVALAKNLEKSLLGKAFPGLFKTLRRSRTEQLQKEGLAELQKNLDQIGIGDKPRVLFDHHHCHAAASYFGLNPKGSKEESLIFTLDGSGDGLCATITQVNPQGVWKRLAATPEQHSPGGIYSHTTRFLGMKILEHEYKVMGLAPYAKNYFMDTYRKIFEPVLFLNPKNPLQFKIPFPVSGFYEYLVEKAVGERFDNIAAGLQYLLEEQVLAWVKTAIHKTGISRVFTGGGVFMNVKLNQRIRELKEVKEVHFFPSCGDESNALGAAYLLSLKGGIHPEPIKNLYLGRQYSPVQLENFIKKEKLGERYHLSQERDILQSLAQILSKGEVVARFSGRGEWGARALGNRSILGHPGRLETFYTVNDQIKMRDFWMPFAPSILEEDAPTYLSDYDPIKSKAPFMITAYQSTEKGKDQLRAALHQGDHTLRPQIVTEEGNQEYYQLIQKFKKLTGIGGLLNTSLNLHGYPLVYSPEQALFTFENSGLPHLALGPYLISKKNN